MATINNAIETAYRNLSDSINQEYLHVYSFVPDEKLKVIFSSLHNLIAGLFEKMNTRLPTDENGNYFWAEESRQLIKCIEIIDVLKSASQNTSFEFELVEYYECVLNDCRSFLQQYRGSQIPPNMSKVEVYYTDPLFILKNTIVSVETPIINKITREYITSVSRRAIDDIDQKNYDSAITKCRTLLEETFCYVIELKNEEPSDSGDIGRLYRQVKELYNMQQGPNADRRVNMLLSGLEKILSAIAEMRNIGSDSHGVGQRRINISEHHARLFVNTAITVSEFVLSVAENQQ